MLLRSALGGKFAGLRRLAAGRFSDPSIDPVPRFSLNDCPAWRVPCQKAAASLAGCFLCFELDPPF
jgi:hypothetical protein